MQTIYHLSHTDLDGYGCQLITSEFFEEVHFFNANYGEEIMVRLRQIVDSIAKESDECLLLITDLNLGIQEATYLENQIKRLSEEGCRIKLQLLDHHASGKESADKFSWYHLDTSMSASMLTLEFALNRSGRSAPSWLKTLTAAINAVDIWKSDHELFEFGKVCMGMVEGAKDINRILFPEEDRIYRHWLLRQSTPFLDEPAGHIALDESIHRLKKSFFRQNGENDTLDNLICRYLVLLLESKKEELTIDYRGYKGILTYSLGHISILGNLFLVQNPDFDFFMNISSFGTFSLRSNNKIDVSAMAKELAGGGGHPNASGGKLAGFKDLFIYESVKLMIIELIQKTGETCDKR